MNETDTILAKANATGIFNTVFLSKKIANISERVQIKVVFQKEFKLSSFSQYILGRMYFFNSENKTGAVK